MDKARVTFTKLGKKMTTEKTLKDALTGATAGSVATIITRPLEVVEQNITTQGKYFGKPWSEVVKGLSKEKALWSGTGAKLLKVAPTMGITFAAYEFLKHQLK